MSVQGSNNSPVSNKAGVGVKSGLVVSDYASDEDSTTEVNAVENGSKLSTLSSAPQISGAGVANDFGSKIDALFTSPEFEMSVLPLDACDPELQEKVKDLLDKKIDYNIDFVEYINKKKAFRNPSIYEKLVSFCNIDEKGSNFRNLCLLLY
ncbi:SAP30-binding protein [Thelohanellus kitauei]|uniref:SAP30-binding protein n=1 Tax=Thelohanellus kitauei TaxID=669202 RepID=A0A0C2IY81_THEKT|nr:SAP30-binding protein [Thelohanellus kitauei]